MTLNGRTSNVMIPLLELDIVSIVGLAAVFFILVVGLCRRQKAKRRLQQLECQRQSADLSAANDAKTCRRLASSAQRPSTIVTQLSHCQDAASLNTTSTPREVQSSISRPSTPSPSDVRRRQPSGSPICSGCQCSMTQCQCTIVLYRPSPTSGDVSSTATEHAAGRAQRRLLNDSTATSLLSAANCAGASDRRSRSGERAATCRSRTPSNERYLAVPGSRSRSSSPSRIASGNRSHALLSNGGGRIAEMNANEPNFKSKMA